MTAPAKLNQYLNNHYEGMDPHQLILMLYKGAVERIKLAREGIVENNPQKRGENLGKVIAIVSELNGSLNPQMTDDGTEFLRGLYTAILSELPKVSQRNDTEILDRTERYMVRLMEIWMKDVMDISEPDVQVREKSSGKRQSSVSSTGAVGYGARKRSTLTSFSV